MYISGKTGYTEYGYSYMEVVQGKWATINGKTMFTKTYEKEPFIIIRITHGDMRPDVPHLDVNRLNTGKNTFPGRILTRVLT